MTPASCGIADTRSSSSPSKASFLEVSYLLIHDALPTPAQLAEFADKIRVHTLLQEEMRTFFSGFPRDAHPMAVLSSAVTALSTFYQDALDPADPEQVEISGDPADGETSDDRGVRVQEEHRPPAAVPGQLAGLRARTSCA